MDWDTEIESPATLAILGAGSVGLEAAIYARFLGYFVEIFDAGRPVRYLKYLGDLLVDESYEDCTSSLGRAAIEAQTGVAPPFSLESRPSFDELSENYFLPLAKTDLLFEHIHFLTRVVSVSRYRDWSSNCDLQDRANDEFRIVAHSNNRGYWTCRADAVLDCTGRVSKTLGLGPGGGVAIGEAEFGESIITSLRHADKAKDFSKLVVIGDHPRMWALLALWKKEEKEFGRITWLAPEGYASAVSPFAIWLHRSFPDLVTIPHRGLESIHLSEGQWKLEVAMTNGQNADLQATTLAAFFGDDVDWQFAKSLLPVWKSPSIDDKALDEWPGLKLATCEPNYYVLGSKRNRTTKWKEHQNEVRDLFAMLGSRRELDLYASFEKK